MPTIAYIIVSIIIFNGLIIWFFHRASTYFRKMDEKVGNIEGAESISACNDCSIRDNISDEIKQNEEKEIKEEQEIY